MKRSVNFLIKWYQKLAPVRKVFTQNVLQTDRSCRFYPTCSEYTAQSVQKYGAIKGGWMGLKRFLRCNPLFSGGYDPVR